MTKIRRSEKRPAYISKSYCLSSEYVLRSILGYYSSISIYNRNCSYIDKLASCQVSRGWWPVDRRRRPTPIGLAGFHWARYSYTVPEGCCRRSDVRARARSRDRPGGDRARRQGALPKATPAPVPSASAKAKANFPARQPLAAAAAAGRPPQYALCVVVAGMFFSPPAWNDLSVASGLRHNFRSKRRLTTHHRLDDYPLLCSTEHSPAANKYLGCRCTYQSSTRHYYLFCELAPMART